MHVYFILISCIARNTTVDLLNEIDFLLRRGVRAPQANKTTLIPFRTNTAQKDFRENKSLVVERLKGMRVVVDVVVVGGLHLRLPIAATTLRLIHINTPPQT